MAANEIHLGDIGTIITLTIKDETAAIVNLSGATTKQIFIAPPTGTTLTKTASFTTDGTDGKITYTTVSGDWSVVGAYKIQAKVVIAAGTFYSDVQTVQVYPNLV